MTGGVPPLRLLSPADDYPTERVIDGTLDLTAEIPRVPLLPPVPAPALPTVEDSGERPLLMWLLREYWWLLLILLLEVLVAGPRLGDLLFAWSVQR